MPLTKSGKEVFSSMKKQYGSKEGKGIFYASINKGKAGSDKWHLADALKKRKGKK